jgi:hypothetical protein
MINHCINAPPYFAHDIIKLLRFSELRQLPPKHSSFGKIDSPKAFAVVIDIVIDIAIDQLFKAIEQFIPGQFLGDGRERPPTSHTL